jgi:hypothetical protein
MILFAFQSVIKQKKNHDLLPKALSAEYHRSVHCKYFNKVDEPGDLGVNIREGQRAGIFRHGHNSDLLAVVEHGAAVVTLKLTHLNDYSETNQKIQLRCTVLQLRLQALQHKYPNSGLVELTNLCSRRRKP